MTIIYTYISQAEANRLSQRDNDYFKRKLEDNCLLNNILHRPVNRPLLAELQCILDRKPLARRKTEQYRSNSEVRVFKDGRLVRIEQSNGKVMKEIKQ